MSSTSWRKNSTVTEQLTEHPYKFSFKQAVRVIERCNFYNDTIENSAVQAVGGFMPPQSECIRFTTNQSLSFPSAEISKISPLYKKNDFNNQWEMNVNFIGLTGSSGVLPYHYTETVLKRLKVKDKTMMVFFNLFNHRTASLFFRSSSKYFAPLEYERSRLTNKNNTDNFTKMLLSLVGLSTKHLTKRLYTNDESLLYYAGLLSSSVRSASGLKQILESHFSLPIEIKEFVGQWQDLIDDVRTRLPDGVNAGQNNQLGRTVMLGKKGWFAQGKINIIIGPLSKKQLQMFTPETPLLRAIDEFVRFYLGFEHDYSFILRTLKKDIPNNSTLANNNSAILGWTTWLSGKSTQVNDGEKIIDIPISLRSMPAHDKHQIA
jgi:type VI secretion system protein ImpH